jgi:sec-independent protein translocase protein TatA
MLGHPEILIVGVIVLVLFGASAIPRFARSIGRAKAEFEKGLTTGQKDADGAEGDRKTLQDSAESDQKTG